MPSATASFTVGRSGRLGSLPIDDQVFSQKGDLVPNDLRAHVRAVEVEVGARVDLEFAARRVIRYVAMNCG